MSAVGVLPDVLGRLKLTAMRDRLDTLLDDAARRDLSLRDALALLCDAEVARRGERRIQMGTSIAKFPFVQTLEGFDFDAQPSLDAKQMHDLATCRWVANGDTLLGVPASLPRWTASSGFSGTVTSTGPARRSRCLKTTWMDWS